MRRSWTRRRPRTAAHRRIRRWRHRDEGASRTPRNSAPSLLGRPSRRLARGGCEGTRPTGAPPDGAAPSAGGASSRRSRRSYLSAREGSRTGGGVFWPGRPPELARLAVSWTPPSCACACSRTRIGSCCLRGHDRRIACMPWILYTENKRSYVGQRERSSKRTSIFSLHRTPS
jgi:hypothetical protein